MPANTSKGFPYPQNGDPVDVAGDIQDLATSIDTYLDSKASSNNPSFTGTAVFSNTAEIQDKLYVGDDADGFETTATLTNSIAVFRFDNNQTDSSYAQLAFQNADSTSSTDIITYMDTGNDSEGWMGIGITGSQFDDATYGITGPGDAYIFHQTKSGATPAHTGNLVIATGENGSQNKIVFAAGGYDSGDTQMEITPGVNVHIEIPTPSTSPSTGALTVVGGVGIQGDVNIQGTITFGGAGTTVETANLSVEDPIVFTGTNNTGDSLDLGLVGKYVVSGNTKYAGVVRDATDGVIKFFKDASTQPTSTVNFAEAGLGYASIKVDGIDASGTVALPSTTSIGSVSATELGYLDGVTSAIQTQLNDKAPTASPTFTGTVTLPSTTAIGTVSSTEIGYLDGVTSAIQTQLNDKAPLLSPTLTGTPLAPTANAGTNTTQIATTAFVTTAVSNVINGAPSGLDTLDELAAAINDDPNYHTTITTALGLKANLAGPTFTGTVTLPSTTSIGNVSSTEIGYLDGVTSGLQAQINDKTDKYVVTNAQTGTAYTLQLSDIGKLIELNNASAITLTVPTNALAAFPVGTKIDILQTGAGQVTVSAPGVTVNGNPGLKLSGQWAAASLVKRATDTWVLIGNISA